MGFSRQEYEQKYEEMYQKTNQLIDLFKQIIEDERNRIEQNNNTS